MHNGGVIETQGLDTVIRVAKHPTTDIKRGAIWSGMALCGEGFFEDIEELIRDKEHVNLNLEDIFEYRNRKYHNSRIRDSGDFVNINSPIHHAYANLLALAYSGSANDNVKKTALLCADEVKELILKNGEQL